MRQAWPISCGRGIRVGRVVIASLIAGLAVSLAGCGADGGAGGAGTAATSNTSASSTTSTTTPATASESSKGSGSTGTSPVTPLPKASTTSSITLGWIPPTLNSDGSPITNLAGYKIHYGTTSSDYTQTIAVANAGLTRYVVDNLPSGTYYFAITAYNAQGMESALSGEISTIVD